MKIVKRLGRWSWADFNCVELAFGVPIFKKNALIKNFCTFQYFKMLKKKIKIYNKSETKLMFF